MSSKFLVLILSFLSSAVSSQDFGDLIKKESKTIDCSIAQDFGSQEGFLAGTQIKVPGGYKSIEDIKIGEFVIGNDSDKQVVCITKRNISKYLNVILKNEIIRAALDQKFYLPGQNSWMKAKELSQLDVCLGKSALNGRVDSIEIVDDHVECYALTVDDHVFFVSEKDICVHNMDVVSNPSSMIIIGSIVLYNPILLTVGTTLALTVIAVNTWQMIKEKNCIDSDLSKLNIKADLSERQYFDMRRAELITLKKQFADIISGLENFTNIYRRNNPLSFSYSFLAQNSIAKDLAFIQPSFDQENILTDDQRINLRITREYELTRLEQEIIDLQITLSFHFNELIVARDNAIKEFTDISPAVEQAVRDWNNNRTNLSNHMIVYQYQEIHLKLEEILKNIENRNYELRLAVAYYRDRANASILKQTTNIDKIISQQESNIKSTEEFICQERKTNIERQGVNEEALIRRNYNVNYLKNETNNRLNKNRESKIAKELTEAKVKKGSFIPPEDPEDDDDEDDFFKKLKKRSDKKVRSKRFGNLYRDPATGLWWSRDTAGHGGPHSKVFKKGSTSFEWQYDADLRGLPILAKHKGPIGLSIPFKEVIFK